jgi:hypothetical protein
MRLNQICTSNAGRAGPRALSRGLLYRCFSMLSLILLAALALTGSSQASPILSEIYYDAVGSDDGHSFVEIQGEPGTLLDGMTLEGLNGSNGNIGPVVPLSGVIPEDGLFVVGDEKSDGSSFVAEADLLMNFDFQNGPDSIVLVDAGGILDAIGYGVFSPDEFFAGEGSSAPDAPAGSSLARVFADLDSDDNAIDFAVLSSPTPGTANFMPVPEPGTALLSALGLISVSIFRRRRPREMP